MEDIRGINLYIYVLNSQLHAIVPLGLRPLDPKLMIDEVRRRDAAKASADLGAASLAIGIAGFGLRLTGAGLVPGTILIYSVVLLGTIATAASYAGHADDGDNDNDGIPDTKDGDDDNDGIPDERELIRRDEEIQSMGSRPKSAQLFAVGVLGIVLLGGSVILRIATDRTELIWVPLATLICFIGMTYCGWRGPLIK